MNILDALKDMLTPAKIEALEAQSRKTFFSASERYQLALDAANSFTDQVEERHDNSAPYYGGALNEHTAALELLTEALETFSASFEAISTSSSFYRLAAAHYSAACQTYAIAAATYREAANIAVTDALEAEVQATKDEMDALLAASWWALVASMCLAIIVVAVVLLRDYALGQRWRRSVDDPSVWQKGAERIV